MKKALRYTPLILCILYSFLPIFKSIGFFFQYQFSLYHNTLFLLAEAGVSLVLTLGLFASRISVNRANAVLAALMLPLAILNGFLLLATNWNPTAFLILVIMLCATAIFIKFSRPFVLKVATGVLSILFLLLLTLICIIVSIFGDLSHNTVVKAISSPQGTYTAEVIDNDQGALGGHTFVEIKDHTKVIPIFIGEFTKSAIRIYTGEWGEFKTMQPYWQDEHTLIIRGTKYSIGT